MKEVKYLGKDITELQDKMVANNQLKNDKEKLFTESRTKATQIESNNRVRTQNDQTIIDNDAEIVRLQQQIERLEAKSKQLKEDNEKLGEQNEQLRIEGEALIAEAEKIVIPDESEVAKQFTEITKFNRNVEDIAEYRMKSNELLQKRHESETMTADLDKIDKEREALIQKAQIPVEGLAFTEEYLTYNGLPLVEGQINSAVVS